ncbi:MAG TPA: Coq4 family protein [Chitinophagaceae bacterium]|nr:Coq4 family protein [Chitinophagaceae bacterium]
MKEIVIRIRSAILVFLTHRVALPVLKIIRKPQLFDWSEERLQQLPPGSLGNDLYWFLQKRNLPLLKNYARHDIKHVLLEYDTTVEGEACLQSFMLGNGRISFPVLSTVLYSVLSMPENWGKMIAAFRKGKRCNSFHHWSWNDLMRERTADIKEKIFNH